MKHTNPDATGADEPLRVRVAELEKQVLALAIWLQVAESRISDLELTHAELIS